MARRQHDRLAVALAAALAILPTVSPSAHANPTPGFVENWTGSGQLALHGWGGGVDYNNPGTGGTGGAGDGYLLVSTLTSVLQHLGTHALEAEYTGDWTAAGIQGIKLWLNDVGAAQPLQIHVAIGAAHANFWEYSEGFAPPHNQWKQFVVDLTSSAGWTQIDGTGTFEEAKQNVTRLLIRHDLLPLVMTPDDQVGDFGLDQLLLTNEIVPVKPTTWGRIKSLYR
jgi:hypothetical protein